MICSVMVFLLFANCTILNEFNRNRTIAISHAQYIMEDIKDQDFSGLQVRINTDSEWDLDVSGIESIFDSSSTSDSIPLSSVWMNITS